MAQIKTFHIKEYFLWHSCLIFHSHTGISFDFPVIVFAKGNFSLFLVQRYSRNVCKIKPGNNLFYYRLHFNKPIRHYIKEKFLQLLFISSVKTLRTVLMVCIHLKTRYKAPPHWILQLEMMAPVLRQLTCN